MSKPSKPNIIEMFENFLWAHSPKTWIFKSTYFHNTLFVSMLVTSTKNDQYHKIRRSYPLDTVKQRAEDLSGLASDCISEMKTDHKNK